MKAVYLVRRWGSDRTNPYPFDATVLDWEVASLSADPLKLSDLVSECSFRGSIATVALCSYSIEHGLSVMHVFGYWPKDAMYSHALVGSLPRTALITIAAAAMHEAMKGGDNE
jgi:hypothetical protein